VAVTVVAAAACTPSGDPDAEMAPSPEAWTPPQHLITVDGGEFVDRRTGSTFVPRGVNYFVLEKAGDRYDDRVFSPAAYDRDAMAADFAALSSRGYNTVRMFVDSCRSGADCIGRPDGAGLNDAYLDVIAEVMQLAADHDLLLLLTSNDLPDQGGYWAGVDADRSAHFPGYRNSHVFVSQGHDATVRYWDDLLSGLAQRGARFDVVFAWSILNEQWLFSGQPPLSLSEGRVETATGAYDVAEPDQRRAMVVDNMRELISRAAAVIREHDPDALVTMGFFAPQFPNPTGIGADRYVDTAPLVKDSDLDFFDFHAYPGEDIGLAEIVENFGMDDRKPVLMGEVGGFVSRHPTADAAGVAVQRLVARSCDLGYDGWLYWGYFRSPLPDATWAFTDADGYLLDALAPVNQPDPCVTTLIPANLAADAPVEASRSLPGEPPGHAVDGTTGTWWGAGAPAPQWIEVDLGEPADISGVRLTVSQSPDGRTMHAVEVAGPDRVFISLGELDVVTADGEVLRIDQAAEDVRYVRVTTLTSPSWVAWRELEVLAA
jgi:hypothetical protein